jgi:hypothetical protein
MRGIEGGPGFKYPKGLDHIPPSPPAKMATTFAERDLYLKTPPYPVERFTTSPTSLQSTRFRPIILSRQQFSSHAFGSNLQDEMPDEPATPVPRSALITQYPSKPARLTALNDTRERESVTMSDIEEMLDLPTIYYPRDASRDSKLRIQESPHPFSVTVPTTVSERRGELAAFPVSPVPSVSNSWAMQDSRSRTAVGEIVFQHTWDEVDLAESRGIDGNYVGNTAFQVLEPFKRAMTRNMASNRI